MSIKNMSTEEKIKLVDEIWTSIEDDAKIKLNKAQKALVDKREKDL
jgi:putative addiction module component (TIGR02574 family)